MSIKYARVPSTIWLSHTIARDTVTPYNNDQRTAITSDSSIGRASDGQVGGARTPGSVTASHSDHIWALDYVFDETREGRPIKVLNVTDEFTRAALACVRPGRSTRIAPSGC